MGPVRVVVIDDSAFMRKMISDILERDPRIEVVATARNGEVGLKKILEFKPDVVTLDVEMPNMNGIETLRRIMETDPIPVVMLSSSTQDEVIQTVNAISNGAVDFITKPSGSISLNINDIKDEIIAKVLTAAKVDVVELKPEREEQRHIKVDSVSNVTKFTKTIVAIGTSTGGPKALQVVLTKLPENIPAPIVIVQHMPPGFTKSLAERLNMLSDITVKEAVNGEILINGTAYIAPGDYQMAIRKVGTSVAIELTKGPKYNGHRPSVDILFRSLADIQKVNKIAVVLTGMGSDGSEGIIELKHTDKRTLVIAEHEATSVVYGMPKAAVKTNCVDHVVHLQQVGETITKLVRNSGGI